MTTFLDFLRFAAIPGALIGIYFGLLKYGHKVGENHSFARNRFHAEGISEIVLTNLKDRSTPIFALYAVQGDVSIQLIKFDSPLVLKSFDSVKVDIPPVSSYLVDGEPYEFSLMKDGNFTKTQIYFATTNKIKKCIHLSAPPLDTKKLIPGSVLKTASVMKVAFNGRIYSDNVIYIISYKIEGKWQDAFVDSVGFIEWRFGPNMLQESMLSQPQSIANLLLDSMPYIEQLTIQKVHGWNRRFGINKPFTHRVDDIPLVGQRNAVS